jgi:uncharacterized protein YbaR (Trm112 family)
MAIDQELLEILVCPETHQPISLADEALLSTLNGQVKAKTLKNRQGQMVETELTEALVREDGKCVYLIDDGIPNMLIDERVDL